MIQGFSKYNKDERLQHLLERGLLDKADIALLKDQIGNSNQNADTIDELSENTLSHYRLPFSVAPNFLVNGKAYYVPMVTEESSVVAAASYAARFWAKNDGFQARVAKQVKPGHIFFTWNKDKPMPEEIFTTIKNDLVASVSGITRKMRERGGGLQDIKLIYSNHVNEIRAEFTTADSMGANFINTCLETIAHKLKALFSGNQDVELEVIMSILSNFTPDCLVQCTVACPVPELEGVSAGLTPEDFARRFVQAVSIAHTNKYRAVTHNKGIFNGIDAVLIATGNDFRSAEANAHAYASENGYHSLSNAWIENSHFFFSIKTPLSIGTVGGATSTHPLARLSLKILNHPGAEELSKIAVAVGLASNFAAIRSLVTDGIQKGHMKLHLGNILNETGASTLEKQRAKEHFNNKAFTPGQVKEFILKNRVNT